MRAEKTYLWCESWCVQNRIAMQEYVYVEHGHVHVCEPFIQMYQCTPYTVPLDPYPWGALGHLINFLNSILVRIMQTCN